MRRQLADFCGQNADGKAGDDAADTQYGQIAEEVYSFAFEQNKIGIGSALSVVYIYNVLLVLLLCLLILGKVVKKYER